ncbi:cytochrome C assembly family protein [Cognatilysobacter lacus]|uniref:Inner membrane protein YpjD n=1 Tax=Cognatilysobacter lacus TaxID=1643323 RepID=A0A5D8Z3S8_9GAMM|nr:cytochrome c biogenesis protein CcsA [Lysobacter lacus]TZF88753.1 inner membrane protein YpjD [Lysobacter lacus]
MTLVIVSLLLYLVATGMLASALRADPGAPSGAWRVPAGAAMALHATVHVIAWNEIHGPDLHFFAALSLVSLGMAAMTTAVARRERVAALAVLALPLAAAMLAAFRAYGHAAPMALDWQQQLHAALALLAYATLAVAALVAVTLWAQERALRRREFHGWLRALPPLVQLEALLFRTIAVGFGLLTATLLTGVLFVENLFAQHLVHKTVLGILSWLAFGALLFGRRRYGWRGSTAVRWTLSAMALLVLAYFGSKAVLELILHRHVV